MSGYATTYHRVAIAAWSAVTPAGDAATSLAAVEAMRARLTCDPAWGWVGRLGHTTSLGRIASQVADDAWRRARSPGGRVAVGIGSSKGDIAGLCTALAAQARTVALPGMLPGALTPAIAHDLGLMAYLPCPIAAACSTGLACLLAGADLIERDQADAALVGAAEASLTPLVIAGFANAGVLCGQTIPQAFAQPTGFAPAEGAAAFALGTDHGPRTTDWRLRVGVRLGDAGHETHFIDPRTLRTALAALWEHLPHPDLIVCHATGTAAGDAYELAGLDDGPWRTAPRLCCKPVIGHCLGASGAVELALALESPARRLWKLSLGFGGHLVAVGLDR